jgi:hypothetical protein
MRSTPRSRKNVVSGLTLIRRAPCWQINAGTKDQVFGGRIACSGDFRPVPSAVNGADPGGPRDA